MLALAPGAPVTVETRGSGPVARKFVRADEFELIVSDANAVLQRIPRPDVIRITQTKRRGSVIGAIAGAGVGFFVGFVSALNLAFRDCGGDCSDEKVLIGLSLVGLPIAGGTIGYYAFRRPSENVIYRAP